MTEARCEGCHAQLDSCGHHRAPCPRSGRVKKRATPTEHTVARIFRESGATVRKNVFLKDMNVEVAAEDARQIEVLAQDLPCFAWAQLAVDVTLRCVLSCESEAHPHAADTDGAVLLKARTDKEMRGLLSAKVPNSSFAEVRMGHLIEPTHKEDEDEEQENEKEVERDGEECRVESRRESRQQHHADDTWMTCA